MMKRNWWWHGLRFVAFVVLAVGVLGAVVMALWNALLPGLFGWHAIGFWQALGLLVLSRILMGGLRGGPGRGMHWRARMMQRWENMSDEERERFRQGMGGRCGRAAPPAGPGAQPGTPSGT